MSLIKEIRKQWGRPARCKACGTTEANLSYCEHCPHVYYCSEECQVNDWSIDHKMECIGKRLREDEEDDEDKKWVIENKDVLSIIVEFLKLKDLKAVSLVTKKMSRAARKHMVNSYIFSVEGNNLDMLAEIKPRKVRIYSADAYITFYERHPEWFNQVTYIHAGFKIPTTEPVQLMWPEQLYELILYTEITFNVYLLFPESLRVLRFKSAYLAEKYYGFPVGLKVLELAPNTTYFNLAPFVNLEEIVYPSTFNGPWQLERLPNVHTVTIYRSYSEVTLIEQLPSTVKKLILSGGNYSQVILTNGIEYVDISETLINFPIILPPSVKYFYVNDDVFRHRVQLPLGISETNLPNELRD